MKRMPGNVVQFVALHQPTATEEVMLRYTGVCEIIKNDEVAVRLLEGLIDAAVRYFGKVVEMENRLATAKFRLEADELRELTTELDQSRRNAHNALISDLHIFNRYLVKEYGEELDEEGFQGGIFPKPEHIHNRLAIADWAGDLLKGIYDARRR